jgi:hypothetical protein
LPMEIIEINCPVEARAGDMIRKRVKGNWYINLHICENQNSKIDSKYNIKWEKLISQICYNSNLY